MGRYGVFFTELYLSVHATNCTVLSQVNAQGRQYRGQQCAVMVQLWTSTVSTVHYTPEIEIRYSQYSAVQSAGTCGKNDPHDDDNMTVVWPSSSHTVQSEPTGRHHARNPPTQIQQQRYMLQEHGNVKHLRLRGLLCLPCNHGELQPNARALTHLPVPVCVTCVWRLPTSWMMIYRRGPLRCTAGGIWIRPSA